MVSGLKYIGKGGFVSGVPARDLTPDEVEKLGKGLLLATGLYEEVKPPKVTSKKSEAK